MARRFMLILCGRDIRRRKRSRWMAAVRTVSAAAVAAAVVLLLVVVVRDSASYRRHPERLGFPFPAVRLVNRDREEERALHGCHSCLPTRPGKSVSRSSVANFQIEKHVPNYLRDEACVQLCPESGLSRSRLPHYLFPQA